MDILSYKLGKNAGGGGGGASEYFEQTPPKVYSLMSTIKKLPGYDFKNQTNLSSFYGGFTNIIEVGNIENTSHISDFSYMFNNCPLLEVVPLFDTIGATNMHNMFNGDKSLNDASVNNVLKMCANATNYTGTKTLKEIGFTGGTMTTAYPLSRLQALSNYQDFINAGWELGY